MIYKLPLFRIAFALLLIASFFVYNKKYVAWTHTGEIEPTNNLLYGLNFIADSLYFGLGMSAWLLIPLIFCFHTQAETDEDPSATAVKGNLLNALPLFLAQWGRNTAVVLVVLIVASLDYLGPQWGRNMLIAPAGGVLGGVIGDLLSAWVGLYFAKLLLLLTLILVIQSALNFSWKTVALKLGSMIHAFYNKQHLRKEMREDAEIAEKNIRQRQLAAEEWEHGHRSRSSASIHTIEPTFGTSLATNTHKTNASTQHAATPNHLSHKSEEDAPYFQAPVAVETPYTPHTQAQLQQDILPDLFEDTFKPPSTTLLDPAVLHQQAQDPHSINFMSRLIEKKLGDFGVTVTVMTAYPGPVITRYEIEPAKGVKGAQVQSLEKDLARSLSLVSVRILQTLPGKEYMAIEIPNTKRQAITIAEIFNSSAFIESQALICIGLGKDNVGNPFVFDLTKTPHLLVAGTTGSGKSVGINAMILSILFKSTPQDVRLILIDPKMLELSVYEGIPHLLCPVVTDMSQASHTLNWAVTEMERRYRLLSHQKVRHISSFNKKIKETSARGHVIPNPFSLTPDAPEPLQYMPYIVIVIDELADLMLTSGKKVEEPIARLTQKARACGMHLILATQRPSVDVITGLIKANVPTRIAFQVSSKIDSRTVLGDQGAETLLGQGDMLYSTPGLGSPTRLHGAFVSDDEIQRVTDHLREQGEPDYVEGILSGELALESDYANEANSTAGSGTIENELYDKAVAIVLNAQRASISIVQRHLHIGYNRAANLLEEMEKNGVVSPMSATGQRKILAPQSSVHKDA